MLTLQENKAQKKIESQKVSFPVNLTFPSGILGFEEINEYSLQPLADLEPFFWMEGVASHNQAFLLVPPAHVLDTYSIEIGQMDVDFLQLNESDDALIFNIVTFGSSQSMTVNLKGPILVNRHSMVAKQVVPVNAMALPTTYPLNN
tara:strand:- start:282 stop:719 length:438 start_codon:yes stop_codon:yes gene_type:complete